jgi:hypothetical protein
VRTYTCACGDSYTEKIAATGHNYADGICTKCGAADPNYNGGESGGGNETGVSNETTWTDGVSYTFDWVENEYVKPTGEFIAYNGWQRTPYLYCEGASRIDFPYTNSQMANYSALYDADKQFVSNFTPNVTGHSGYVDIPEGVAYFVISKPSNAVMNFTATPRA